MMQIGDGAEVEFLVVMAGSGRWRDISGTFMPFPLCYCSGELLPGSSEGSWSREKWQVSAAKQGRGRGENGRDSRSRTAAMATFLLGGREDAELPLRSGEELACSGSFR
jgi:hypothetical protein